VEPLKNTNEAAEVLTFKPQTLRSMRSKGGGPPFIKLSSNRVAYRPEDLERWVRERTRRSTADPGNGQG
jgi:predicted DNA-binding transcriptional regulator AlpA